MISTPASPAAVTADTRDNSYDLLRLLLAALVLYTHMHKIVSPFGPEAFATAVRGQTNAGTLAVLGFFGLSGYLVAESCRRCVNPIRFLARRALRILPGYWVCLLVTAGLIAPTMFHLRHGTFVGYAWTVPDGAGSYIGRNALLYVHQWSITGVASNGIGLNGSLWSLFPEFCCYLILAFVGSTGLLRDNRVWLLCFTFVISAYHALAVSGAALDANALPTVLGLTSLTGPVLAFLVGSCACAWREHIPFGARGAVFFILTTLVTLRLGGYALAAPLCVPLALLHLGRSFTCQLPHDFSYGLYIYGCPCQQLLALVPLATVHPVVFLLCSVVLAVLFAAASWFAVERPFIRLARTLA